MAGGRPLLAASDNRGAAPAVTAPVLHNPSPAGSPHPLVSAWILSKQELSLGGEGGAHGGGGGLTRPSQRRLDELLAQCRHDVQALARLKHPCVLRLIAPLEETRTQLVFITEPLSTSLADLLGGGGPAALPPAAAQERRSLQLSGGKVPGCCVESRLDVLRVCCLCLSW